MVVLGLWLCWLSRGWDFLRKLLKCCKILHQMLHLPLRGRTQELSLLVTVRGYMSKVMYPDQSETLPQHAMILCLSSHNELRSTLFSAVHTLLEPRGDLLVLLLILHASGGKAFTPRETSYCAAQHQYIRSHQGSLAIRNRNLWRRLRKCEHCAAAGGACIACCPKWPMTVVQGIGRSCCLPTSFTPEFLWCSSSLIF